MAQRITLEHSHSRTYATEANVDKAVAKLYANDHSLRYFIERTPDGRFFPVFIGGEKTRLKGVHFHFHVVG